MEPAAITRLNLNPDFGSGKSGIEEGASGKNADITGQGRIGNDIVHVRSARHGEYSPGGEEIRVRSSVSDLDVAAEI